MLGNVSCFKSSADFFFFKIKFFQKLFQCHAAWIQIMSCLIGYKLFAKVISRPQKRSLAGKVLIANVKHIQANIWAYFVCLFVWFSSLHPSQQFFSHVGTDLLRLNQY